MVLQVLAVVVPLLIAAIPLFRWPTLQRRVREHVSLLKELPEGMGKELRAAVEEELRELAHRAELGLGRRAQNIERAARIGFVVVMIGFAYAPRILSDETPSFWDLVGFFALVGVLAVMIVGLVWFLWRVSGALRFITFKDKRERLWRRAQAEGKHMVMISGKTMLLTDEEFEEMREGAASASEPSGS